MPCLSYIMVFYRLREKFQCYSQNWVPQTFLIFGMDHTNTLKVKELWVLLRYHFGSERLKGTPKKVELVETDLFWRDWESLMQRVGGGGSVVTKEI